MPPARVSSGTLADVTDPVLKRKYQDTLEEHASQLVQLGETQSLILNELQGLVALVQQRHGAAPRPNTYKLNGGH